MSDIKMHIITTMGPASESEEIARSHLDLGVHAIRFTFSKETPDVHVRRHGMVKDIAHRMGKEILSMADLPGGKPRLSNSQPMAVASGRMYRIGIGPESAGENADFFVDPPLALTAFHPGGQVSIGDGENMFLIQRIQDGVLGGVFAHSGELERRRGFIPRGRAVRIPSFTEKDKEYCGHAHQAGFDWIAPSFVGSAEDLETIRAFLVSQFGWRPKIIAKIETQGGVERTDEIASVADGLMVARGDLAVQIGFEHLWEAQKKILDACRRRQKYSIVATGLLDSLNAQAIPTRSEIMDICAAFSMGADALMLSAETTIGKQPVEAVRILQQIARSWKEY